MPTRDWFDLRWENTVVGDFHIEAEDIPQPQCSLQFS